MEAGKPAVKAEREEFLEWAEKVKTLPNIREEDFQVESRSACGGAYGDVSFGTYRGKFAVKKDFKHLKTMRERIYNYREAYTLANCNHENIVKFMGAGPNTAISDIRYVVLEKATNASLAELISSPTIYTIWHVMLWNLHLADGLEYLHSLPEPIIHRDLKPLNMLLFHGGTTLKISDFGCSKIYEVGKEDQQTVDQGSQLYMAPEVRRCNRKELYTSYSEKVDIYSLTVSLWEMLTRVLQSNMNPQCMDVCGCPPFLQQLFDLGLSEDPKQRPSASQLVRLFDFIVRKVFPLNISQLRIKFGTTSFSQQVPTYPVNSPSPRRQEDETESRVPENDPADENSIREITSTHGSKPSRENDVSSAGSTDGDRTWEDFETREPVDFTDVPVILRPILPTGKSEREREAYRKHVGVALQYVKLYKMKKYLSDRWRAEVETIVANRGLNSIDAELFRRQITEYCEGHANSQQSSKNAGT